MVAFPNCKINLGLNIIGKRNDGYHDLETVFFAVPLTDALEIIGRWSMVDGPRSTVDGQRSTVHSPRSTVHSPRTTVDGQRSTVDGQRSTVHSPRTTVDGPRSTVDGQRTTVDGQRSAVNFTSTGLPINGAESDNLCVKAYQLLKQDLPDLPTVKMHLHKVIPMGAGLGGGSADGAFALQLLNNTFQLQLTTKQLIAYALQLGSDCPFFIINKPCFATSRGEIMQPINLDLSNYQLVLVNPKIHIGTGWAFSNITPQIPTISIQHIIGQPIETWKNVLVNDFQKPAIQQYPAIGKAIHQLYQQGAVYSAMTGSGSTVFGLFSKDAKPQLPFPENYFVYSTLL
ncbi:MAG: 4-(cytidine 5'-diphospho)-2-C-methyl-D-erythritol kinase [Flavobacterium sp.]|nr:4-(cytidine 5'-diphospho)-2-C-methyl-D-erythritol kinase [Flavobacterium sp.]